MIVTSVWNRLYPRVMAKLPKPPAPTAPAMAVNPITLITVNAETRMIPATPSGK